MNQGRRPLAMPSSTHSRISAAVLHRILPAVRLFDAHAEDAADRLASHGGAIFLAVLPVGPGSHQAAARLAVGEQRGRQFADALHVQFAQRSSAGVGDIARRRVDLADLVVPQPPELEQALLPPHDIGAAAGSCGSFGARQIEARWPPGNSAGSARSSTSPNPSQRLLKMPSTWYSETISRVHLGHEFEVIWTQRAGDPQLRHRPVASRLPCGVHRDPVRMGVVDVLVRRVRIGAGEHHHAHLAAAGHEFAEGIARAEPLAAIVQRDLGGIVGDATPRAQTSGIGVRALEVVQPEARIVLAGVVLDQRQLRPPHGTVEPARRLRSRRGLPEQRKSGTSDRGRPQKVPAIR